MSITLTQTPTARFPDRPATGGIGLLIAAEPGTGGAAVSGTLGISAGYQRLLFAPQTLAGGRVVLARTLDGDGWQTSAVAYDATQRRINASIGDVQLSADLIPHLEWHCVSFGVDVQAGEARLWINGVLQDSAVTGETEIAMAAVELGAVHRDPGLTGQAYLDEWAVGHSYLPPVLIAPTSAHADDPARWLVIYNTASEDSCAWAQQYRAARGIPCANLLGLSLSLDETISTAAFDAFKQAVDDYLSDNGLQDDVLGIVCGHGVPGYYTVSQLTESVVVHLQRSDGIESPVGNPLIDQALARPSAMNLSGHRMTARIDAPTLTEAVAEHERAQAIETSGLGGGEQATLYLDPVTTGTAAQSYMQDMIDWAQSVQPQLLRLPMAKTEPTDPETEVTFDTISNDGFFWGWRAEQPSPGFFGTPAGKRAICVQLNDMAATAPTLRDAQSTSWALAAMEAGYAITAGTSGPVSVSTLPDVARFFEGLRLGWTVGEAWFAASPYVRDGLTLIGDPLMRVPMPRAGWNVYGPFETWADVHCDTPCAALRENEASAVLQPEAQLSEGQTGIYLLRRVDANGREERGCTHVRVQLTDGKLVTPPLDPALSEARQDAGGWRLTYLWPRRLAELAIARVELLAQVEGQVEQVVAEPSFDGQSRQLVSMHVPTEQTVRYRLRTISADGGTSVSHWSRWLSRRPVTPVTLEEARK
jgi:uncharacterized protein (TIGR03790 family)